MKNKLTLASAIIAVSMVAASQANAGLSNVKDGDLLLCFHAAGTSSDLEIDLGSYLSPVSSVNINSDLTTVFGSSWYNNSALQWSVIGADQNGGAIVPAPGGDTATYDTLFLGSTVALQPDLGGNQDGTANEIEANYGLIESGNATNTTHGVYTANSSNSGPSDAYSSNTLQDIQTEFSSFTLASGDIGSSGHDTVTMMELQPSDSGDPSYNLGTYTLSGNGNFSTTAVPEPSTWASIALGALALVGFRRRRS
jgi:hypothetical protein